MERNENEYNKKGRVMNNLGKAMRAKFLKEEIELLKERTKGQASGHIHTAIVVLEDQLYVLEGTGLHDDG